MRGKKRELPDGMGYCCKCNQYKPLDDFYKDKARTSGVQTYCKQCHYKQSNYIKKLPTIPDGMSRCYKCKHIKPLSDFYLDRSRARGVANLCKPCHKLAHKDYNTKNKDKIQKYSAERRALKLAKKQQIVDAIISSGEKRCNKCNTILNLNMFYKNKNTYDGYVNICKECTKKYKPERTDATRAAERERRKKYFENNKEAFRASKAKSARYRLQRNPKAKLRLSITKAINRTLLAGSKGGRSWEKLLGYTIDDLKAHLEKKFKPGMSWDNRGEWHIDHIIPVSAFNFSTHEHPDFKRCWALSNLQPMWAHENIKKSNKLTKHFQPMLAL